MTHTQTNYQLRILITGSRYFTNRHMVRAAITQAIADLNTTAEHITVVHGAAPGADSLADSVARELGCAVESHPADWKKYGRAAGPIRNNYMVSLGAQLVLAFPLGASPGTRGCIRTAEQAGIPVRIITE